MDYLRANIVVSFLLSAMSVAIWFRAQKTGDRSVLALGAVTGILGSMGMVFASNYFSHTLALSWLILVPPLVGFILGGLCLYDPSLSKPRFAVRLFVAVFLPHSFLIFSSASFVVLFERITLESHIGHKVPVCAELDDAERSTLADELIPLTSDENRFTRLSAVDFLTRCGAPVPRAHAALTQASADPDPSISAMARSGLDALKKASD